MFIQIDLASSVALYEQVVQQVKFAIAAGSVRPNELIPSVRELSKQLTINPNTVARAYRTLQDEGYVYVRRGTGLAVADNSPQRCQEERKTWFDRQFRKLFENAVQSQLRIEEIEQIVMSCIQTYKTA